MRTSILSQLLAGAIGLASVDATPLEKRDGPVVDIQALQTHTFPKLTLDQAKDVNFIHHLHQDHMASKQWIQGDEKESFTVASHIFNQFGGSNAVAGAHEQLAAATTGTCATPEIIYEWRDLSDTHKQQYIAANLCLFKKPAKSGLPGTVTRWDDLAALHQKMDPTIHGVGQFLPWHRYYLKIFKTLLRNECGYTGPMTWWDETKDAGNFNGAVLFTATNYFGHAVLKTPSGQGTCITSGAFGGTNLNIGPGASNTKHCLSRAVDEGLSGAITQTFVNQCNGYTDYNDMWQCSFYGPHAYGHDAMGGVMSDIKTSPGDPIFFMHHGFVDHSWRIWQNMDSSRLTAMGGCAVQTNGTCPQQTTLNYVLTSGGMIPDVKVSDVMNLSGPYLCSKYNY